MSILWVQPNKVDINVADFQLVPADAPLESVCIDILEAFIKYYHGNEYILVIFDKFTKLLEMMSLKGQYAAQVARVFVNSCVFNEGPPKDLIIDNGKCFTSKFCWGL